MRFYEASSMITSSPEAVWAVLADGDAWPSWGSGVERLEGQIAPGEKITVPSPLLGLIWRSMPDLGLSFEQFAQGLKRRVETGA